VNRTRPLPLLVLAVLGLILGFTLETVLAAQGLAVLIPPLSLALALVLIAAVLLVLAWPVRAAARGHTRVDPFYATRVVVLAKASALAAALLSGAAAGILTYLLSRAVLPLGSTLTTGATLIAAAILVSAALVAEHLCSLPPNEDELDEAAASAT
jgi:hypothetical protein